MTSRAFFLAAFAQRKRYDITRGTAGPWLYGIATNLVGSRVCAAGQREVIRQQITKLIGRRRDCTAGPETTPRWRLHDRMRREGKRAACRGGNTRMDALNHLAVWDVSLAGDLQWIPRGEHRAARRGARWCGATGG